MSNIAFRLLSASFFVIALLEIGCTQSPTSLPPTSDASATPMQWSAPVTAEQVRKWSPQECKAVLTARTRIEADSKAARHPQPDVMEFRVTPTPSGWEVMVIFAGGYENGKAISM